MRRIVAATVAVLGLAAFTAVPAAAQDSVLDLPPLGFEIDRTEGFPGDVVTGHVDVDDVAERCVTAAELQGNVSDSFGMVGANSTTLNAWAGQGVPDGFDAAEQDYFAEVALTLAIGVLAMDDIAEMLWEATFVFAFGDIATEEILDASGSFDPATGDGSIVVPAIDPGTYALAATCVILQSAGALIDAGLTAGLTAFWDWVDDENVALPEDTDPLNDEWQAFVEASAFEWVPELVDPRAIGIALFCVLNPDGTCPGGADPATDEPLTPLDTPPDTAPTPAPALITETSPRFTG